MRIFHLLFKADISFAYYIATEMALTASSARATRKASECKFLSPTGGPRARHQCAIQGSTGVLDVDLKGRVETIRLLSTCFGLSCYERSRQHQRLFDILRKVTLLGIDHPHG